MIFSSPPTMMLIFGGACAPTGPAAPTPRSRTLSSSTVHIRTLRIQHPPSSWLYSHASISVLGYPSHRSRPRPLGGRPPRGQPDLQPGDEGVRDQRHDGKDHHRREDAVGIERALRGCHEVAEAAGGS